MGNDKNKRRSAARQKDMVANKAAERLEMAEEKAALYASFLCLTLLLQLLVSISIGNVLFLSGISSKFSYMFVNHVSSYLLHVSRIISLVM
jgi:hypothetical protein